MDWEYRWKYFSRWLLYNVSFNKLNEQKARGQRLLLGNPKWKIGDIIGIILMKKIPSSKPIMKQVGAKDYTLTEKTRERYTTFLYNIHQSHADIYVTDIQPHPNQNRYKMSNMIDLNNR